MRNVIRLAFIGVMAAAMTFVPYSADAQVRRGTTTNSGTTQNNSGSTGSAARSASATRSAGTSATRSNSSDDKNTAATQNTTTQVRRGNTSNTSTSSATRGGATVNRNTSAGNASQNTNTGSNVNRSNGSTANRQAGSATSSAATVNRGNANAQTVTEAPASQNRTTATGVPTRSNSNVTSKAGLSAASEVGTSQASRGNASQSANKGASATRQELNYAGHQKMDDNRNLNRIPPRDRGFLTYDRPASFYGADPHMFGYRVQTLPASHRRYTYWGVDYYFHNNVYYRRYGNHYVVCRPPFGVIVEVSHRDLRFSRVRFSYYFDAYYSFNVVDRNYRTIMDQNREIARNNALLALQYKNLALNSGRAASSYEIARALGLVQSYAGLNTDYFYQDGVFYTLNRRNRYEVIVPPAGALVDELPDDYDILVLNGVEYYKVDDTVYRLVLIDGIPCLEVLGQMYGSMANKYNYYYNY